MIRRIVLIKHNDTPRDDRASAWLAVQGFQLDWRHPHNGDRLDDLDGDVAGTILYGGPQPVPERDRYPFLADELRWIERCMARDVPTLGICLGGQLVAHALGAEVGPPAYGVQEFGYYALTATPEGASVIPDGLVVAQSHYHEFALPQGATLLARSALFACQAFRYGARTFAFQFHPELIIAGLRRWQDAEWAPWGRPGTQSRAEQDALAVAHDAAQHTWFTGFLERLFGLQK